MSEKSRHKELAGLIGRLVARISKQWLSENRDSEGLAAHFDLVEKMKELGLNPTLVIRF